MQCNTIQYNTITIQATHTFNYGDNTFFLQTHCGKYSEDFYRFQRHGLIHCYVSSGISAVKIPSLAHTNNGGQLDGYDFSTTSGKKASYYYALGQFNKLNSHGSGDLPYDLFYKDRFLLPFCLSADNTARGTGPNILNRTQPRSMSPSNDFFLYVRFEAPTQRVFRISVVYSQQRAFAIEHDRSTFKGYEPDQ